ncbi:unnamed protein product [Phytomonas sp. EM1]|nr:unnamed protein product [Phytomonas sp. EM1]|eukprot:CCW64862.1 unnamed protein product [Phytomonas sp. isolate EM1]
MIHVSSLESFRALQQRVSSDSFKGLVVHFAAKWCEPCGAVRTALEAAAEAYREVLLFAEVDAEVEGEICELVGVDAVPFVVFYRTTDASSGSENGLEKVAAVAGAKLDLIERNLLSLYGENGGRGSQRGDFDTLDGYLDYLTKRPGVVAFITGTPSHPRCGFTGRLCGLLQTLKVPFVYYDVMASDEVCEGLKRYSNWPTFPQVYVNGVLIGGYDVCKQLHEEGELKSTLMPE